MTIRLLVAILLIPASGFALEIPVGIPEPEFGVHEAPPQIPTAWPAAAEAGYYYIDNSHPNATDSSNEFGYPDRPRLTIPTSFRNWGEGTYIEIHGGPYEVSGNQWRISANGSAENPTWLVGDTAVPPILRFELVVEDSSYLIIENLKFDTHRRWIRTSGTSRFVAIRNCELTGDPAIIDRTSMISIVGQASGRTTDIVLLRNIIHSSGDRSGQNEVDINGITNSAYTDRVWILENHIYNLGGDSVRTGQNEARMPEPSAIPRHTYIGGNRFHDNGENAIDVKHSADVVISGNVMHGFLPSTSSAGEAIVVHENAQNIWIIGNQVSDSAIGLINTGGLGVWYVGNEIFRIHSRGSFDPNSSYGSGVAMHFRGASSGGAINNTIFDVDKGLQLTGGNDYEVVNNIFASRAQDASFDIIFANSSVAATTAFHNNLFTQFRGGIGSTEYSNVENFQAGLEQATGNVEGEPLFVNSAAANFSIQSASDALDKGIEARAYELFQSLYGINIRRDALGRSRPLLNGWDIGSRELVDGKIPKSPGELN